MAKQYYGIVHFIIEADSEEAARREVTNMLSGGNSPLRVWGYLNVTDGHVCTAGDEPNDALVDTTDSFIDYYDICEEWRGDRLIDCLASSERMNKARTAEG